LSSFLRRLSFRCSATSGFSCSLRFLGFSCRLRIGLRLALRSFLCFLLRALRLLLLLSLLSLLARKLLRSSSCHTLLMRPLRLRLCEGARRLRRRRGGCCRTGLHRRSSWCCCGCSRWLGLCDRLGREAQIHIIVIIVVALVHCSATPSCRSWTAAGDAPLQGIRTRHRWLIVLIIIIIEEADARRAYWRRLLLALRS
jgi:hypothetical protein